MSVRLGSRTALREVSLTVRPGEAVALVGPSGAGKTTLLRLFAAHVAPDRGRLELDGRDVSELTPSELRELRARAGFVHQDLRLVDNLRVSQNVLFGALGRRSLLGSLRDLVAPRDADLERVHALLERLGIADKLFHRVDSLSGGERQRVAIARALFQEPHAIFADEPVAALDPARSRDTLRLLVELARERGLTLLLSLHDLELAREFLPRVVGLREGRVLLDGAPREVEDEAFTALYALDAEGSRGEREA